LAVEQGAESMAPVDSRTKILIVDDAPVNIRTLSETLRADYEIIVALDGESALRIARESAPDLILLDILMPGLDGYQVCERLAQDPVTEGIPVIFITSMSGEEDERKGFAAGAVDYVIKPFSPPLVQARVQLHVSLLRARRSAEEAYRVISREIQTVADLQLRLLPQGEFRERGLTVSSLYRPSGRASGDYYDFFSVGLGRVRLAVADVSGHGARAAFVMAMARSLFRAGAQADFSLERTVGLMNEQLIATLGDQPDFVTMFAAEIDLSRGRLEYVNAGHCPGLLRTGSGEFVELASTCPLLGFFEEAPQSASLETGDSFDLFLYTDGLYEWRTGPVEIFALERFLDLVKGRVGDEAFVASKLEEMLALAAPAPFGFDDDMTALLARRRPQAG